MACSDLLHDVTRLRELVHAHDPALLPTLAALAYAAAQVNARDQREVAHQAAQDERNRLYRALAAMLPSPVGRERKKGRAILRVIARYESTRWGRDEAKLSCPPEIEGKIEGLIWRLKKIGGLPRSVHRINDIIDGRN